MTIEINNSDSDSGQAVIPETEEANEHEITRLLRQIMTARDALTMSETALAAIEESLSGKAKV